MIINGYLIQILHGTTVTLEVAACAVVIGIMIGILGALLESAHYKWLRYLATGVIAFVRGLPELLIIFAVYFSLNSFSPFFAAVTALSLIFGAYASQVFRGAFLMIEKGQVDAGRAMGLSNMQVLTHIQIPQVWRHAIPGLGNLWLVLLKDTALVTLIGLSDMMNAAKMAASTTHQPFTYYFIAACVYLLITSISQFILDYLSKYANRYVSI
jgi:His/Glu/Gln/Arg/opine family amino acid ABC transporter permease subunit